MAVTEWLSQIKWDKNGLIPAIAQDYKTGKILMMAWMNQEALALTAEQGHAVYWSRSRQKLWHKGESSGHQQQIKAIRLDCDSDVIILQVEQKGGIACHTGRESCFFRKLTKQGDKWTWQTTEPVLKDPDTIYQKAINKDNQ
ncbi:phosphoribosyl-AMP cyclohydrolase [Endozoicomonas sp. SM1973]|uniref:Phosphoribosyl-AMP cyclohydrolase n=1 Tax=Spartinivicinus marinus TaxID=2994442 RepID=A0A853I891_9GAMM|nr:phosphoribosyl-AMP cyclohydrolase [Spartinivicinus marinus]MCX4026496.1 phosphoribosyl-AMP cyclohydrolase [Spartinivicinus marinus]NYZ66868.1 phosphoribosyl-AMP cyclohydrolase [Spartinivicinus marinus]